MDDCIPRTMVSI